MLYGLRVPSIDGTRRRTEPARANQYGRVRRAKTEAKVSQRAAVSKLVVTLPESLHAAFAAGRADLLEAGSIDAVDVVDGEPFDCEVQLSDAS